MSETIINSNQVRASGDTSTQTLINENQVRASGDTSSETLINPNQIAGGGEKTLNLTSVNGATYDSDYIFTVPYDGVNRAWYFETNTSIDITDTNNSFELVIKFKTASNLSSTTLGVYRRNDDRNFGSYIGAGRGINVVLGSNRASTSDYFVTYGNWYYIKVTREKNSSSFYAYTSTDGEETWNIINNYSIEAISSSKISFGRGHSLSSNYWFYGSIDFKETDIIINGTSVLWV